MQYGTASRNNLSGASNPLASVNATSGNRMHPNVEFVPVYARRFIAVTKDNRGPIADRGWR